MAEYKAVLFDAGATLWHLREPFDHLCHQFLRSQGFPATIQEVEQARATTEKAMAPDMAALVNSGRPSSEEQVQAFWNKWQRVLLEAMGLGREAARLVPLADAFFLENEVLYPEVPAVLEELKGQGYRMAIVSNGWLQPRTAHKLGIAPYFDIIVGSAYVGYEKPHPRIFHIALEHMAVPPTYAVMVGDNYEADVLGAKAAGALGVHVVREGGSRVPGTPTVSNLQELLPLLQGS